MKNSFKKLRYSQLLISLNTALSTIYSIILPPIISTNIVIRESIYLNPDLVRELIISQASEEVSTEIIKLYNFSIDYRMNSIYREELVAMINSLLGDKIEIADVLKGIAITTAMIIRLNNITIAFL